MQIYTIAKNVLGALGGKVKVPVLDSELKLPAECMRIVGALDAGSIIEQGENANGEYTKFADGTMICTKYYGEHPAVAIVSGVGSVYISAQTRWDFPAAFANIKRSCLCSGIYSAQGGYAYICGITYAGGNDHVYYNFIAPTQITLTSDIFFQLLAIGRWKA